MVYNNKNGRKEERTMYVVNALGHDRYTDSLTGRCTICDLITVTDCRCGRCLDLNPYSVRDAFGNLI
tara:strand:- start:1674 stop:1874 length:201 start_codon:yes stop_codon:yes gene_type:complete